VYSENQANAGHTPQSEQAPPRPTDSDVHLGQSGAQISQDDRCRRVESWGSQGAGSGSGGHPTPSIGCSDADMDE